DKTGAKDAGAYDPYWSDFDAKVDLVPDAEPPAKQHVWADWTAFTIGEQGSATATFALPGDGGISLTYSGQLYNAQVDDGGVMYWRPDDAYKSAAVPNAPATSDNIMLAGGESRVHTLTFSAPVTNPVLAVMSMGSNDTTTVCRFDDDFELLSHGVGFYGEGQPLKHLPDHVLSGRESSGAIRFPGTYTTIRWLSVISEPWYGLTVGLPSP
ncbi:MAG TPA: hypothetical protein VI299_24370, partial [Polyangiales bacterium]